MSKVMAQPKGRPEFDNGGYYGLLGEIAMHGAQVSEGDPIGIYFGLLPFVSGMVGRTTTMMVKTTEHPLGISTLLIGPSGNGKKGSAVSAVMPHLRAADPPFMKHCIFGAVASGEGIVASVADPTPEQQMLGSMLGLSPREGSEDDVPMWPGGRRATYYDPEFSTGTMVALPMGTTAAKMRECFDGGDLYVATKKDQIEATRPHVTFHGHTTPGSFAARLDGMHAEGGTYNRFLVCYVYRSKIDADPDVPRGWYTKATQLGKRLGERTSSMFSGWELGEEGVRHITMDRYAKALWKGSLYEELSVVSDDEPEFIQQFTTRFPVICLRLASLYAGIGGSDRMSRADLEAAAKPVRYSLASIKYTMEQFKVPAVNGESPKEREQRLRLRAEMEARGSMTREEISHLFNRNLRAEAINKLLGRINAQVEEVRIPNARRAVERFSLPKQEDANA